MAYTSCSPAVENFVWSKEKKIIQRIKVQNFITLPIKIRRHFCETQPKILRLRLCLELKDC